MTSRKHIRYGSAVATLALALALAASAPSARANVYATNIKLNGLLSNATIGSGGTVNISYILNEPALTGVTIKIRSGATVVRTINVAGGGAGALKGSNTVAWNGKDDSNVNVPAGTYSITITSATSGFGSWTKTSDDSAAYYVPNPRGGMAVNNNSNSTYYGRVFVGNPKAGSGSTPADALGVIKFNADGSYADEGAHNNGGYNFFDDGFFDVPHNLRFGQDDRLYANDWSGLGKIVAFDSIMSTNQVVLDSPNYANNPYYSSLSAGWGEMDVTDTAPGSDHPRVWFGGNDYPDAGIWFWNLIGGVADPNDTVGTQAAVAGGSSALSLLPSGNFMVDILTNIYVAQSRANSGDPAARVILMDVTNNNDTFPYTLAAWAVGGADDSFRNIFDTAIASRVGPTYVASAMFSGGGVRVLYATNGSVAVNINAGNSCRNVAWDNVGNLYLTASVLQRWQAWSPPTGPNSATTPSVFTVTVFPPPVITSISVSSGTVTIHFTGGASTLATAYTLVSTGTITGSYTPTAGQVITGSGGSFTATAPTGASPQFYRIRNP